MLHPHAKLQSYLNIEFYTCAHAYGSYGGRWNRRGCHLNEGESTPSVTVCECNHLTHFAMMLSPGVEVCTSSALVSSVL